MKEIRKIKLTFKNRDFAKDKTLKKWLKTCENVINQELQVNPITQIFVDHFNGTEIWFTTIRPLKI